MSVYNKSTLKFGKKYIKRNPVIMGDKSDGSINTAGNLTLSDAEGTIVIKQYKKCFINSGHTLSFTNKVKGCFLLCSDGLIVEGTIDGDEKGYMANDSSSSEICEITSSFNTHGKGIGRGSFQLNRTSPYFWFKTDDTEYPADDIVFEVTSVYGGDGGTGGNGGATIGCAAEALGGYGGIRGLGGPYAGAYAGGGGGGADINGAGGDGDKATDIANGAGSLVGTDGGTCTGSPGLNIFTWGRYINMKTGSSVTSSGGDGGDGVSSVTAAPGGGSGADGAGAVCKTAILPIIDNATTTLDGGEGGSGGTSTNYMAGGDGGDGEDGTELNQVINF